MGEQWVRFAVECDVPASDDGPSVLAERCRSAAAGARTQGFAVRFLRCVHLPEQASAVLLFEAATASAVDHITEQVLGRATAAVALGGTAVSDELA